MRNIVLFLCFFLIPLIGESLEACLIVSYQTGPEGERLDRIRFRLTDEKKERRLFPEGSNYACDGSHPNRTVVINDLAPGEYVLRFLIPNTDGLFEDVSDKSIVIRDGESVMIDQYIQPCYASLDATAAPGPGAPSFVEMPRITLLDPYGETKDVSSTGSLVIRNLLPGNYTIVFEDLAGYVTPESKSVLVKRGERLGPYTGFYYSEFQQQNPFFIEQEKCPMNSKNQLCTAG